MKYLVRASRCLGTGALALSIVFHCTEYLCRLWPYQPTFHWPHIW